MHKNHMKWLAVLCLAPIGVFIILQALGVGLGQGLMLLLFLLCPLSHLLMMRGMGHKHGGDEIVEAEKEKVRTKNTDT
jgi:hypothetical protein